MDRLALHDLLKWKGSNSRKPLVLQGARQVGKSYIVKSLFAQHFQSFLEINLEKQPEYRSVFEGDISPKNIIPQLEVLSGKKIVPYETLLFIDEIQVVPRALLALRYFYEEMPSLHVIAAGSLLQFAIDKVGVPVGRVTFKFVAPLSFQEFLINFGNEQFLKMLESHDLTTPLSESIHEKGLSLLSEYMALGGMPEVLSNFYQNKDYNACQNLQAEILQAFQNDFPKYAKKDSRLEHVALVFERAPNLAMEHLKFVNISRDIQAKYLRVAIDTLRKACILNLVFSSGNIQAKASFDPDNYKLSFLDVGLLQRSTGLAMSEWIKNKYKLLHQGNLTEQFVAQEIVAQGNMEAGELFFWERHARGSSAEVDFLVPIHADTIPVEVKSGKTGSLKSLHLLLNKEPNIPYAIKTSTNNFSIVGKIRSIPLYAFSTWLNRARE